MTRSVDRIFAAGVTALALLVPLTLAAISVLLFIDAWPSLTTFGLSYFTTTVWDPVKLVFGAAAYVYGTIQQPVQVPAYLRGAIVFMGINFAAYRLFLVGTALVVTLILVGALEYTRYMSSQLLRDTDALETVRRTGERDIPAIVNIHNVGLARRYADRIVGMSKGEVVFDGPPRALEDSHLLAIYGGEGWLE